MSRIFFSNISSASAATDDDDEDDDEANSEDEEGVVPGRRRLPGVRVLVRPIRDVLKRVDGAFTFVLAGELRIDAEADTDGRTGREERGGRGSSGAFERRGLSKVSADALERPELLRVAVVPRPSSNVAYLGDE